MPNTAPGAHGEEKKRSNTDPVSHINPNTGEGNLIVHVHCSRGKPATTERCRKPCAQALQFSDRQLACSEKSRPAKRQKVVKRCTRQLIKVSCAIIRRSPSAFCWKKNIGHVHSGLRTSDDRGEEKGTRSTIAICCRRRGKPKNAMDNGTLNVGG